MKTMLPVAKLLMPVLNSHSRVVEQEPGMADMSHFPKTAHSLKTKTANHFSQTKSCPFLGPFLLNDLRMGNEKTHSLAKSASSLSWRNFPYLCLEPRFQVTTQVKVGLMLEPLTSYNPRLPAAWSKTPKSLHQNQRLKVLSPLSNSSMCIVTRTRGVLHEFIWYHPLLSLQGTHSPASTETSALENSLSYRKVGEFSNQTLRQCRFAQISNWGAPLVVSYNRTDWSGREYDFLFRKLF